VLSLPLVLGASLAYLLLLFAVAAWADRRAQAGRSVTRHAWIYTLSIGVYCSAWTYFGSVGRAATSGLWFLPIYLGPTLAMLLAWTLLRRMVRIARTHRITSIADFIATRYGKSRTLASLVTLIALVGVVPYIALQLKAIASGVALMTGSPGDAHVAWWRDSTFAIALLLAGFTIAFGTRHLDASERHPGMVAAVALESVVKLAAFVAVGVFVCWGLFDSPAQIFTQAAARADLAPLLGLVGSGGAQAPFAGGQWFALTLLAGLSLLMLPRQFQVMVVENVDERHLKRATWAFPLYLLAINLFVLPIALGGLLHFGPGANAETFVLSLPLALDHPGLALAAFIGGLSAATGMVIVESIAVSTMVCNDLVMPALLRAQPGRDFSRVPLAIRRVVIVGLLLLGYAYFRVAGEAYALVSIGLISFAAVAQFAPALIGGLWWRGGTRAGGGGAPARSQAWPPASRCGPGRCCCRRSRSRAGCRSASSSTGRGAGRGCGRSSCSGSPGSTA
jgi:Na+/proline symporter